MIYFVIVFYCALSETVPSCLLLDLNQIYPCPTTTFIIDLLLSANWHDPFLEVKATHIAKEEDWTEQPLLLIERSG